MSATPKYSIVIPTADRPETLEHTLRACLAFDRDDIEIIVSDNCSTEETAALIKRFANDTRLKSFRTNRRLHMPAHWAFAAAKATGSYVLMNGDDDYLAPDSLSIIDAAVRVQKPKVISWGIGLYHHPDFTLNATANSLTYVAGHSNYALKLSPRQLIENFQDLEFSYLPEVSHACIERGVLERITQKAGAATWKPYPDFTPAVLCLLEIEEEDYVYIDSLLGCGGRSGRSNAAGFSSSGNKRGNADRISAFVSEFGDDDMYPHHALKTPFYYNGHVAALSIAAQIYPEKIGRLKLNYEKLFRSFYEEAYGLKPNPLVDEGNVADIKRYAAYVGQDNCSKAVDDAVKAARKSAVTHGRRSLGQKTIGFAKKTLPTGAKQRLRENILALGFSDAMPKGEQHRVLIRGEQRNFSNGFELNSRWREIVSQDDPLTFKTLEHADRLGLLISAFRLS